MNQQLELPTNEQIEAKDKAIEIFNWLLRNKTHEKYQKGIQAINKLLKENNLMDWFIEQDLDFEVSMEIYNKDNPADLFEYAKKLFS